MPEEIKELTQSTQKELGGDNVMFAVAFDTAGNQFVFRGIGIKTSEASFPEPAMEVTRIDAMSVVSVKRNPTTCCVVTIGGRQIRFCWG